MTPTATPTFSATTDYVGSAISVVNATWNPMPTAVTYQWYRDFTPIPGATSSSYTLQPADDGQYITFSLEATRDGYQPADFTADSSPTVWGAPTGSLELLEGTSEQVVLQEGVYEPLLPALFFTVGGDAPGNIPLIQVIWQREDATNTVLAEGTATYTPTAADVGYKIRVTVIAYVEGYRWASNITVLPEVLPSALQAVTPTISGSPLVGSTLTASGGWNITPDSVDYQWMRDGIAIDGATSQTYQSDSDDIGHTLSVSMTASRFYLPTVTAVATADGAVTSEFPSVPTPIIGGSGRYLSDVTADPGDWGVDGTTFTYEWFVPGLPPESTGTVNQFAIPQSLVGQTVQVQVTATAPGFGPETSVESAPSTPFGPAIGSVATVAIAGPAHLNEAISAVITLGASVPSDTPVAYVWNRDGVPIQGASGSSYTPQPQDYGQLISVTASLDGTYYTSPSVTSNSLRVGTGQLGIANPYIEGAPTVGNTLVAGDMGPGWSPSSAIVDYTWWEMVDGHQVKALSHNTMLTVSGAMYGMHIQLWESASAPHCAAYDASMLSQVVTIVGAPFEQVAAPTIGGLPRVGSVLTVTPGASTPSVGVSFRYQWFVAANSTTTPTAIAGATEASLDLTAAELGKVISVRETASKPYFASESVWSTPSLPVIAELLAQPHSVGPGSWSPNSALTLGGDDSVGA